MEDRVAREIGERVPGELPGGILAVIKGFAMQVLQPNTALSAAAAANMLEQLFLGRPSQGRSVST